MTVEKLAKKYFEKGDCCVVGEKGAGKDMLFGNVICSRRLDYVGNVEYKRKGKKIPIKRYELDFSKIDVGGNTYKDFINGTIKPYVYPYPQGCDIYISDVGVYLPSQYCNELNRDYKNIAVLTALLRQIGTCHLHMNCQNISRIYDKLREHSRTYITCLKCKVIPLGKNQFVIQKIRVSEKYDSCANNVPKLKLPLWAYFGRDKLMGKLYKLNYDIQHGKIEEYTLVYFNKCDYDTNVFRTILRGDNNEKEAQKTD